jgi:hypothetical protein
MFDISAHAKKRNRLDMTSHVDDEAFDGTRPSCVESASPAVDDGFERLVDGDRATR